MYGTFGREITNYTVIYGAYIQFWPTLDMTDMDDNLDDPGRKCSLCLFGVICTLIEPSCPS